jgi:hypothetical protein
MDVFLGGKCKYKTKYLPVVQPDSYVPDFFILASLNNFLIESSFRQCPQPP